MVLVAFDRLPMVSYSNFVSKMHRFSPLNSTVTLKPRLGFITENDTARQIA